MCAIIRIDNFPDTRFLLRTLHIFLLAMVYNHQVKIIILIHIGKVRRGSHMHILPWSFPQLHLFLTLAGFARITTLNNSM